VKVSVIDEGDYGQTEGVFLRLLSFARAKKVRRLPAATGTTAIGGKALSIQYPLGLKGGRDASKETIPVSEKT
jgi:hypothetical protein